VGIANDLVVEVLVEFASGEAADIAVEKVKSFFFSCILVVFFSRKPNAILSKVEMETCAKMFPCQLSRKSFKFRDMENIFPFILLILPTLSPKNHNLFVNLKKERKRVGKE
jgi:hypothetical protein